MKKTAITLTLALLAGALSISAETQISGTVQPAVVKKIIPQYPASCMSSGTEGTVVVEGLVTQRGQIIGVTAVTADCPELADAAVAAVNQWEFAPMMKDGQPTEAVVRIPVHFTLDPMLAPDAGTELAKR